MNHKHYPTSNAWGYCSHDSASLMGISKRLREILCSDPLCSKVILSFQAMLSLVAQCAESHWDNYSQSIPQEVIIGREKMGAE